MGWLLVRVKPGRGEPSCAVLCGGVVWQSAPVPRSYRDQLCSLRSDLLPEFTHLVCDETFCIGCLGVPWGGSMQHDMAWLWFGLALLDSV